MSFMDIIVLGIILACVVLALCRVFQQRKKGGCGGCSCCGACGSCPYSGEYQKPKG